MRCRLAIPFTLLALVVLTVTPILAAPEYVIVTRKAFATEFEPLAAWRSAHGLSAEVRTVE